MDIARRLLKTTLLGIKNGTAKPDLSQWALLEDAGLARDGLLTAEGWQLIDPKLAVTPPPRSAH